MHMIPRLLWPIALSILWISSGFYLAVKPCDNISKKGSIRIYGQDVSVLNELCSCNELTKISFKDIGQLNIPICLSTDKECVCTANANLTTLSFSKTAIQRLPAGIEEMKQLEELDISFTNIAYLPDYIVKLTGLQNLNLRGTKIVSLPEGLENLDTIDMRMIDLNRRDQEAIREQYPSVKIYFSSPCQCQ